MPKKCAVHDCRSQKTDTYHRIPRNEIQRQIWLNLLDISDLPAATQGRVCSKHFKQSDFTIKGDGKLWLKKNACPLRVTGEREVNIGMAIDVSVAVNPEYSSICNDHNYTKLSKRITKPPQRRLGTISVSSGSKVANMLASMGRSNQNDSIQLDATNSRTFIRLANQYTGGRCSEKANKKTRRFKAFFGVTPEVCAIIWDKICDRVPVDFKQMHLLWGLVFLKQYSTGLERQSVLKADEKTIRKWAWVAVELLSNLNVIAWENRKSKAVTGETTFCSLDNIDFKIQEPNTPGPKWYSSKLRTSALRYDVGLCIRTGHIVWKSGGYPAGDWADILLARESYAFAVEPGEKTFAKKEYRNEQFFILPKTGDKSEHDRIMAAHDKLRQRLRLFQVLKQPFRNNLDKHPIVVNAVLNVIQITLENEEPLDDVDNLTTQLIDEPKNVDEYSHIEEVWIKTEPGDDIEPIDNTDTPLGIDNIKTEPVDEVNPEEWIKTEISLGDYECIPSSTS